MRGHRGEKLEKEDSRPRQRGNSVERKKKKREEARNRAEERLSRKIHKRRGKGWRSNY